MGNHVGNRLGNTRIAKGWGRATAAAVLIAAACLLAGGWAEAGKPQPPAPPLDGGVIYFTKVQPGTNLPLQDGLGTWVMSPDGSGKALLTGVPAPPLSPPSFLGGVPSQALHGGERWFLDLRPTGTGETYASGEERHELWIQNQAGTKGCWLTWDLGVVPNHDPYVNGHEERTWAGQGAVPDAKVSYVAHRWVNGAATDIGFYVVTLDWTAILAGTWSPADHPATWLSEVPVPWYATSRPPNPTTWPTALTEYDWSPDGTTLVYTRLVGTGPGQVELWRIGADGSSPLLLAADGPVQPCWGPTGTIAFQSMGAFTNLHYGQLDLINPDGTGRRTVLPSPGGTSVRRERPRFSPNGTHLVYVHQVKNRKSNNPMFITDVYRCTVTGTGETNLTADTSSYVQWPVYWRP